MALLTNKYALIGAACAGLGIAFMLYKGVKKVGGLVEEGVEAINPLNNDNIINQGAVSLYQAMTGSQGTPGGDFYDGTHGGAIDITSSHNFIYQGVSDLGSAITGEKGWDLGSKLFDWTH